MAKKQKKPQQSSAGAVRETRSQSVKHIRIPLWPKPLAFVENDPSATKIKTMQELLAVSLPPTRPAYETGRLEGTKQMNQEERMLYNETTKMTKVVFLKDLVTQAHTALYEKLQLLDIKDTTEDLLYLLARIHPSVMAAGHSKIIHCEGETEMRAYNTLFRPALLAICEALKRAQTSEEHWPDLGSAPSSKVIPDGRLCLRDQAGKEKCILTIEYKTPFAMLCKDDDTAREAKLSLLWELQYIPTNVKIDYGQAMRFLWPTPDESTAALIGDEKEADPQTRILIQVWTQMVVEECHLAVLSSEDITIFFARGKGENQDTLYLSPPYTKDRCPLYAVYCWFAVAYGLADLKLPDPVVKWKEEELIAITASGITPSTLYSRLSPQPHKGKAVSHSKAS
ncbi:uncharacterized protein B0H18DRAFT_1032226 [Fomitopsis serialis]|uniref:uncharacterized protein n=1 Tax=Fomitopsis serialis TaxID=139415 RepID=UPI0020089B8D|nr:uncharacterized protein B0H18DRAFT_1032226 [Neoantrodia serialis]KAH9918150.1 hypothetical protein B0H18DRAFT_1032226 [Neoantrodia serialis]